ncbi:MAG: SUMF1/EgtB/PvdO family nonheme iron enzyme [Gammaproteobacteria bacterium]|nr:SUMF1/EgtB/PvdO family nonheme iron enzyme [Gammaproteobacteria bacterium]
MAKKFALLIGNSQYADNSKLAPLNASIHDIGALEGVLQHPEICGFDDVKLLPNPSLKESLREISKLFADKSKDDLLLFYFSGHGVKDHAGDLFFAIQDTEWGLYDGTAIPAAQLKIMGNKSASQRQVWILDCCHGGAITKGFKGVEQFISEDLFDVNGFGREIITATDSLEYAKDGDASSENAQLSLFTRCLVDGLETGDAAPAESETITVEDLYQYAHRRVKAEQPGMTPRHWRDRGAGKIHLAKNPQPVFTLPDDLMKDLIDANWRTRIGALHELEVMLQEQGSPKKQQTIVDMLKRRKDQERDRIVYQKIESLMTLCDSVSSTISITSESEIITLKPGENFRDSLSDNSQGPEMIVIPSGTFKMGDLQGDGYDNEKPVHDITIEKPYALSKYPVTFTEYDLYCENNALEIPDDKSWGRDNRPVINVSWEEAFAYCDWLSKETGKHYRLPSEAEWEYAARAGTETSYWWGNKAEKDKANYGANKTKPVDQYPPNPFGLHDMSGNVWEWVQDCYHDSYQDKPMRDSTAWDSGDCVFRVLRGGSCYNYPRHVRSALRFSLNPHNRFYFVGFRLAQDL